MQSVISTNRLCLRNWMPNDISPLAEMNQDEEVMRYFCNTLTESVSMHFYNRINLHLEKYGFGLYVVENRITQEFMGYTGFMRAEFAADFTPCVEIGWRFKKEFWGNGYATEAATACLEYGFSELEFETVHSFTSSHNKKSAAVMERIGMQKMGEFLHPNVPNKHFLQLHVHYTISK